MALEEFGDTHTQTEGGATAVIEKIWTYADINLIFFSLPLNNHRLQLIKNEPIQMKF